MATQPVDDPLTEALTPAEARRRSGGGENRRRWTRGGRRLTSPPIRSTSRQRIAARRPIEPADAAAARRRDRDRRRRRRDPRRAEDHAGHARRLSHARPQGRRALCRQGAQPARTGCRTTPMPPDLSNRLRRMVAETARDGGRRHPHRGRGAAARMQPDQAADAALQCAAARRQVVSADPSRPAITTSRSSTKHRGAREPRAAAISARSPRPARSTAP